MPRSRRAERLASLLSLVALVVAPPRARAQQRSTPRPEIRVDAIDIRSRQTGTLHAGAGLGLPLGYYGRLDLVAAGGITRRLQVDNGSGRADVIGRFLVDPFREMRWGLSIGGGASVAYVAGDEVREYLVLVVDVEAPPLRRAVVPAFQVGLGGGVRVGVVARRYRQGRR